MMKNQNTQDHVILAKQVLLSADEATVVNAPSFRLS